MIRKFLVPAAALAAAAPAFAADLPYREAPPPVYAPAVPLFTWTGLYLGGQIGYAWGTDTLTVFPAGFGTNFTPNGVVGGAHIGYNLQLNQFVAGLEGDIEGTGISRSFSPGGALYNTSIPVQGSIRGRLGVAFDRALLYATGGAEFAGFDTSYTGIGLRPKLDNPSRLDHRRRHRICRHRQLVGPGRIPLRGFRPLRGCHAQHIRLRLLRQSS